VGFVADQHSWYGEDNVRPVIFSIIFTIFFFVFHRKIKCFLVLPVAGDSRALWTALRHQACHGSQAPLPSPLTATNRRWPQPCGGPARPRVGASERGAPMIVPMIPSHRLLGPSMPGAMAQDLLTSPHGTVAARCQKGDGSGMRLVRQARALDMRRLAHTPLDTIANGLVPQAEKSGDMPSWARSQADRWLSATL